MDRMYQIRLREFGISPYPIISLFASLFYQLSIQTSQLALTGPHADCLPSSSYHPPPAFPLIMRAHCQYLYPVNSTPEPTAMIYTGLRSFAAVVQPLVVAAVCASPVTLVSSKYCSLTTESSSLLKFQLRNVYYTNTVPWQQTKPKSRYPHAHRQRTTLHRPESRPRRNLRHREGMFFRRLGWRTQYHLGFSGLIGVKESSG